MSVYQAAFGTLFALLISVAVVGNLLVIIAVFTVRRLKRNSNYFIASLAVADLLVSVMVMTFAAVNDLHGWVFGATFCRIWISIDIMACTASILSLGLISFDRYGYVTNSQRYNFWMTTRKTMMLISSVWIVSALVSFVPVHLNWHTVPGGQSSPEECILDLNATYAIVTSCISFYIPCIFLLVNYTRLYVHLRRNPDRIRKVSNTHRSSTPGPDDACAVQQYRPLDLGIIIGLFIVCWCPFFVVVVMTAMHKDSSSILTIQIVTWLGYANSCFNPIVYAAVNADFRCAFKQILSGGRYSNRAHWSEPEEQRREMANKRMTEGNFDELPCQLRWGEFAQTTSPQPSRREEPQHFDVLFGAQSHATLQVNSGENLHRNSQVIANRDDPLNSSFGEEQFNLLKNNVLVSLLFVNSQTDI